MQSLKAWIEATEIRPLIFKGNSEALDSRVGGVAQLETTKIIGNKKILTVMIPP
jgi:hypothetical protein